MVSIGISIGVGEVDGTLDLSGVDGGGEAEEDAVLLESGDDLLLESGDRILLE